MSKKRTSKSVVMKELDTRKKKKRKSKIGMSDTDFEKALKKKAKKRSKESKEEPKKKSKKIKKLEKKLKKTNALASLFGKDSLKIQKLLEKNENDNAIILANRAMLQSVLDLIPLAEQDYRERRTDRSVYALNALLSQARELISDIQAANDKTIVIDRIIFDILQPQIINLANQLINSNYELKRRLKEHVAKGSTKEVTVILDDMSKSLGAYSNSLFNQLKERISAALSEM